MQYKWQNNGKQMMLNELQQIQLIGDCKIVHKIPIFSIVWQMDTQCRGESKKQKVSMIAAIR